MIRAGVCCCRGGWLEVGCDAREEGGGRRDGSGTCLVFSQECVHITSHCR